MLRAVAYPLVALLAAASLTPGVVADDIIDQKVKGLGGDECLRAAAAWTDDTQPRVDIYVSPLVDFGYAPDDDALEVELWNAVSKAVEKAWKEVDKQVKRILEDGPPGQIGDGKLVVQIEVTLPGHEDKEIDGLRMTYEIDLISCA